MTAPLDLDRFRRLAAEGGLEIVERDVVPVELFVEVLTALQAAHEELEQLTSTEMPLPQPVVEMLRERKLLMDAIAEAPEDLKGTLRGLYVEAEVQLGQFTGPDGPTVTLMPGTLEAIDEVWELLRRAAITDRGVDVALKRAAI